MEEYIMELEGILTKLANVPKRVKQEIPIRPIDIKEFVNPVENESDLVRDKEESQKTIQELKEKLFDLEIKIETYKRQMKTLNTINAELVSNEKNLRDALLKCKGAIRVLCRIRPSVGAGNIRFDDRRIYIEEKPYNFDAVFDSKASQEEIFQEVLPEVESVSEGYNVCIFAYGQTGSGKTYTMSGNGENVGVIFRSIEKLKNISEKMRENGFKVTFSVKYVEVYNENIRDLLSNRQVTIVHDSKSVKLKDCDEITVNQVDEIYSTIRKANENRKTGATNCNAASSRSHSVFVLRMVANTENEHREGTLCMIDLAGSERLSESKAENERLKETQFINKSLSALGNVIAALKRKDRHIPFRDSKLTHLMEEYLSGKSRTTMIVNVNPESQNETVCTLRFATKVTECNLGSASKNINKFV